ncbi:MAG: DUF2225 domain-containing protein [Acidobacteriota bacterium]
MNVGPFFEKDYSCPVCRMGFKSLSVRSSASYVSKQDSDFHVVYSGASPLHYTVVVCPICNYSASAATFNDPLPTNVSEFIAKSLSAQRFQPLQLNKERTAEDALTCFQMAVQVAQLKQAKPGQVCGLLHATAWVCRELNLEEAETLYLQEALTAYMNAYENESSPPGNLDQLSFMYLIGELHRRLRKFDESVYWYNKVITDKDIKKNVRLDKLTREQWQLARQQAKLEVKLKGQGAGEGVPAQPETPSIPEPPPSRTVVKAEPAEPVRKRGRMQMMASLYNDQIEWLTKLMNRGYEKTAVLLPKEEVLRAVLDAFIEQLGSEELPRQFKTEKELTDAIKEMLNK